jgi:hypothetical protein
MDSDAQTPRRAGHALIETESARVRHHEADEVYLAEHDWETDESLSATVAAIIEAISDGDSGARPPLYDSVNPDALDRLFEPVGGDERTRMAGRIVFPYRGFLVTVHADGEIEVHDGHDDSANQ